MLCPDSNLPMKIVWYVRRVFRIPDKKCFISIPVYYSESENKYHRGLPDSLVPFKHYTVDTITDAVNDDQDLDQYSFPSDSSRSRWKKLAYELLRRISEKKQSDSSDSLPETLRNIINGSLDSVKITTATYSFSTEVLVGLLLLRAHQRL